MRLVASPSTPKAMHAFGRSQLIGTTPNTSGFEQPSVLEPASQVPSTSKATRNLRRQRAAFNTESSYRPHSLPQRAHSQAHHSIAGASHTCEYSPCSAYPRLAGSIAVHRQGSSQQQGTVSNVGRCGAAGPNNSLNLRANGMAQSPRHSAGVHFLWRGLCAMPSSPG